MPIITHVVHDHVQVTISFEGEWREQTKPVFAGNFPTGDLLEAPFLILHNDKNTQSI